MLRAWTVHAARRPKSSRRERREPAAMRSSVADSPRRPGSASRGPAYCCSGRGQPSEQSRPSDCPCCSIRLSASCRKPTTIAYRYSWGFSGPDRAFRNKRFQYNVRNVLFFVTTYCIPAPALRTGTTVRGTFSLCVARLACWRGRAQELSGTERWGARGCGGARTYLS